jgi:hypothetical protein
MREKADADNVPAVEKLTVGPEDENVVENSRQGHHEVGVTKLS